MTKLKKYGFIFIAPGYKNAARIIKMNSKMFEATIAGVSTIDSGCKVAKKMVENGVQVIELCGGFKKNDLKEIKKATSKKVPVGLVKFDSGEKQKLNKFLTR